jgi:hypothetical protein
MITISSPEVGPSKYFLITITVAHMLVRIFYFPDNPGYGTGTGARVKSLCTSRKDGYRTPLQLILAI